MKERAVKWRLRTRTPDAESAPGSRATGDHDCVAIRYLVQPGFERLDDELHVGVFLDWRGMCEVFATAVVAEGDRLWHLPLTYLRLVDAA